MYEAVGICKYGPNYKHHQSTKLLGVGESVTISAVASYDIGWRILPIFCDHSMGRTELKFQLKTTIVGFIENSRNFFGKNFIKIEKC